MRARPVLLVAAVVVLAAVAGAVFLSQSDDGDDGSGPTTTTVPEELEEAVLEADVTTPGLDETEVGAMIEDACDVDSTALAEQAISSGLTDPDELAALLEDIGRGAQNLCPDVAAEEPQLLNEAYGKVLALLEESSG
jgi:hypothetical protein